METISEHFTYNFFLYSSFSHSQPSVESVVNAVVALAIHVVLPPQPRLTVSQFVWHNANLPVLLQYVNNNVGINVTNNVRQYLSQLVRLAHPVNLLAPLPVQLPHASVLVKPILAHLSAEQSLILALLGVITNVFKSVQLLLVRILVPTHAQMPVQTEEINRLFWDIEHEMLELTHFETFLQFHTVLN
uniref:DZF domain-containing protein n=1 Tax=Caenorhabditis tropicalis TaxID=1561998 RepID=A0A1I7UCD6_9PELO